MQVGSIRHGPRVDLALLVAFLVGALGVLQGGLNKKVGAEAGLSGAALINTLVLLSAIGLYFLVERVRPDLFPELFRSRMPARAAWWWALPGLSGLFIVFGFPWAIGRIGATTSVLLLIAAKILSGVAWDGFAEGRWPGPLKIAGAVVVLVGAVMASIK